MADFIGQSRTNYFKVKPDKLEAFTARMQELGITVVTRDEATVIYAYEYITNLHRFSEAEEDYEDVDIVGELEEYVEPGQIIVMMGAGAEKIRYIDGFATAYNTTTKETLTVRLDDIYKLLEDKWGIPQGQVNLCEY